MKRLLLVNGPNINLLGMREKEIYGDFSLKDIVRNLASLTKQYGYTIDDFQSNHEGELIDRLQEANGQYNGIIFNPAAYTHTSIALRDVIKAIDTPVIEVHISNVHQRESFRHTSMLAPVCYGQIVGLGISGYRLAALAFIEEHIERNEGHGENN
ncbi:type II 3-dehydroquinate dehydratase [Virgibacillus byunsanensis]|uniref:3-dehydroquinate dehydratase n=1 Tax=Virgibacillus byunsanensis TaxID=570945 RepID=A0ABW3LKW0_9BACI